MGTDRAEKIREMRLRNMAARQGLRLRKSPRRDRAPSTTAPTCLWMPIPTCWWPGGYKLASA
jgi:hypothetical protein